jgi:hypothetical protein
VSRAGGFLTLQGKILPNQRQFFVKQREIIYNLSGKSFNLTLKISILISIEA